MTDVQPSEVQLLGYVIVRTTPGNKKLFYTAKGTTRDARWSPDVEKAVVTDELERAINRAKGSRVFTSKKDKLIISSLECRMIAQVR